jgi:hypothetical protein
VVAQSTFTFYIDGAAPTAERLNQLLDPNFTGYQVFVDSQVTAWYPAIDLDNDNQLETELVFQFSDTYDGQNPIPIDLFPISISNATATLGTTTLTIESPSLSPNQPYSVTASPVSFIIEFTNLSASQIDNQMLTFSIQATDISDAVGNTPTDPITESVMVDAQPPTITIVDFYRDLDDDGVPDIGDANAILYYDMALDQWWANAGDVAEGTVYLVFTVSDTASGIASVTADITLPDGSQLTGVTPSTVDVGGTTYYYVAVSIANAANQDTFVVTVNAVDNVGFNTMQSATLSIDSMPPTLTVVAQDGSQVAYGSLLEFDANQPPSGSLDGSASDAESGVNVNTIQWLIYRDTF